MYNLPLYIYIFIYTPTSSFNNPKVRTNESLEVGELVMEG